MSCNFCNMKVAAAVDKLHRGERKVVGTMVLLRSGKGESEIEVELGAGAIVTVSALSTGAAKTSEQVEIPTYVSGRALGVKYCPFCGEEL